MAPRWNSAGAGRAEPKLVLRVIVYRRIVCLGVGAFAIHVLFIVLLFVSLLLFVYV